MKKRAISILGVFAMLAMVLIFGACGGGTDKASGEGTELTFWIFLNPESGEDPRNLVLREIVEEYNATNTMGNTVKVESIHWSRFESQAIQAAGAQTGPDIINIYTDMLKQHIAGGTVQPITRYAEAYIPQIEGYSYSADSLKIEGEIYTLPWESRTFTYWYRTDIFPQAPANLEALAREGGSKSTAIAQGFVIGLSENSNAASFMESFIPFIRSAGGSLFDANGKAVFNSDAGIRAMEYFKSLITSGAMDRTSLSMTVDEIVDAFKAGTILSCNAGTQRASAIRSSELNDKIASAPILGFSSGVNPSPAVVAGQSLGVGKFCKNPEAAFDFIKTFYTQENQVKWLKANVLPVRATVYDDSQIKSLKNYSELRMWNEYASGGQVEFYPEDYSELSANLVRAAQEVVFNNADAKAQLDRVANWYNGKNGF
ncbi:ABC transporter substrate-binding protein [Breznakiella homolactica]|uniref:Extracellular solute-binding protein n=1 Tax=Breznakiella homolactica TaxID=2798577 RepID=A0A7T7XKK3_9SPIR|nr:extracellular solute-binding protein [Breznakiella homolactica]QQO07903.1 extracellular solute-binding protein [Breznakiella homolactica]